MLIHILWIIYSTTVGNKNTWPEFEIIEDQSECNVDTSEDNHLSNSLILRNRSDDTMNSLMDSFQVLTCFH